MKLTLFSNTDWYLYNFRLPLIRALRARGDDVLLISPPGEYHHHLLEEGFNWISFPLSRSGINIFTEAGAIARLRRLYQQQPPDVFVHFTIKCVIYGSLAARMIGGRVILNSIDGLGYVFSNQDFKARALRYFVKPLYRLALNKTSVIFQNPDDQKLFVQMRMLNAWQGTLIKGVGVDPVKTRPTKKTLGKPLVTFAGRMLYSKGVADFVNAAREIHKKGIDARFLLVGVGDPGNPESISDAQIRAWLEEGLVEWWGWQEDMGKVYDQTDIFCLPSYREGVPRSLMEAAANGIPLIATDVPGCREVVRHEENGLLVPVKDVFALTNALERLIGDERLRQKMGENGQSLVEREFSTQKVVSETIKLIDSLHPHKE